MIQNPQIASNVSIDFLQRYKLEAGIIWVVELGLERTVLLSAVFGLFSWGG